MIHAPASYPMSPVRTRRRNSWETSTLHIGTVAPVALRLRRSFARAAVPSLRFRHAEFVAPVFEHVVGNLRLRSMSVPFDSDEIFPPNAATFDEAPSRLGQLRDRYAPLWSPLRSSLFQRHAAQQRKQRLVDVKIRLPHLLLPQKASLRELVQIFCRGDARDIQFPLHEFDLCVGITE